MKQKNLYSVFVLLFISTSIFSQSFEWGGRFGGIGEDVIKKMHVDDEGATYTTGYFTDTADFDITMDELNLTSNGFYDVFVQKTNSEGDLMWAVSVGGEFFDYGTAITTDDQGNVYITGYFDETTDFDPGPDEFMLVAQGGGDIFILKLNSDGEFVWAKTVGGTGYEESTSIGVDELGNVYVLGYLYETVDFDPDLNEFLVDSQGAADVFLLILDGAGNFNNVYSYGGIALDLALDLSVKSSTKIFISGFFEGTADLDPRPFDDYFVTATDGNAGYIMQIDQTGAIINVAYTEGGNSTVYTVEADSENNMYMAGIFDGTVNFDPTSGNANYTYTSDLAYNGFIIKVTSDGTVAWARQLASEDSNFIYDMEVGSDGNVYSTGFFGGTLDFDPSATGEFLLTKESPSSTDAFMVTLDSDGAFINAFQFGGVDFIDTHQIGVDSEDNIYLSGQFDLTVDINPLPEETEEVTALDFRDNYLLKMNNESLGITDFQVHSVHLYPNPTTDELFVVGLDNMIEGTYTIYTMLGQKITEGIITSSKKIPVSFLNPGVYTITFPNNKSLKFIKS